MALTTGPQNRGPVTPANNQMSARRPLARVDDGSPRVCGRAGCCPPDGCHRTAEGECTPLCDRAAGSIHATSRRGFDSREIPRRCRGPIPNCPCLWSERDRPGIAAMSALQRAGVDFEGIEFHSQVGGIWDQSNPLSSVYDSLTTNTSRYTTHLGPPMPREWPDYPHHRQAHGYLERFADESGILPRIRFLTSFEGARKSDRQTWIAALRSVGEHKSDAREYRAIIRRDRYCITRRTASIRSSCARKRSRADSTSFTPATTAIRPLQVGKRVLVVGLGVSGTDIANEISRVAARTLLSFRSVPWIVPLNVLGPAGRPGGAEHQRPGLPFWLQRESFRVIRAMTIGDPRRLGLPVPTRSASGTDSHFPIEGSWKPSKRNESSPAAERSAASRSGVANFDDERHCRSRSTPWCLPRATSESIRSSTVRRFGRQEPSRNPALPDLPSTRSVAWLYLSEAISPCGCWPIFLRTGARHRGVLRRRTARRTASCAGTSTRDDCSPRPTSKGTGTEKADGFHVDVRHVLPDAAKADGVAFRLVERCPRQRSGSAPIKGTAPDTHDRNTDLRRRSGGTGRILHERLEDSVSRQDARLAVERALSSNWELFSDEPGARDFLVAAYDGTRLVGAHPDKARALPVAAAEPIFGTAGAYFSVDPEYQVASRCR